MILDRFLYPYHNPWMSVSPSCTCLFKKLDSKRMFLPQSTNHLSLLSLDGSGIPPPPSKTTSLRIRGLNMFRAKIPTIKRSRVPLQGDSSNAGIVPSLGSSTPTPPRGEWFRLLLTGGHQPLRRRQLVMPLQRSHSKRRAPHLRLCVGPCFMILGTLSRTFSSPSPL
jgi:hypothetical protein